MIVTLTRAPTTDQGTFGAVRFGARTLRTLELPWRDNARQRSCIPAGVYQCALVNSPRFGLVYGVRDVPGRTHILIHPANLAGDVDLGWTSQLHGCIAIAKSTGLMRNNNQRMQAAALVSRPAVADFMAWAAGLPFTLEVS